MADLRPPPEAVAVRAVCTCALDDPDGTRPTAHERWCSYGEPVAVRVDAWRQAVLERDAAEVRYRNLAALVVPLTRIKGLHDCCDAHREAVAAIVALRDKLGEVPDAR